MKIVQGNEVPAQRGVPYRGGTSHQRRVIEGEPGTLGNFSLTMSEREGDYYSPRHRHNFEQIRFQLAGVSDYGRTGKLTEGMIGYYPEGVPYGPQTQKSGESAATVTLQFGGASGNGYLSRDDVKAGMDALKQFGEFKDGVFFRRDGSPGKRNMDAYQAIWEHVNQRPMVYPKPRYATPILMEPAHYEWVPVEGVRGAFEKLLGIFTERRNEMGFIKIEAGAAYPAKGAGLYLVLSGAGTVETRPFTRFTTIHLESRERTTFHARETAVILHFGLPNLDGIEDSAGVTAQAAA